MQQTKLVPGKLYNFHCPYQDDFVAIFISMVKISLYYHPSKLLYKSQVLDICLASYTIEELQQKD